MDKIHRSNIAKRDHAHKNLAEEDKKKEQNSSNNETDGNRTQGE